MPIASASSIGVGSRVTGRIERGVVKETQMPRRTPLRISLSQTSPQLKLAPPRQGLRLSLRPKQQVTFQRLENDQYREEVSFYIPFEAGRSGRIAAIIFSGNVEEMSGEIGRIGLLKPFCRGESG